MIQSPYGLSLGTHSRFFSFQKFLFHTLEMADTFSDLSDTLDNLISDEEEGEIVESSGKKEQDLGVSYQFWREYDRSSGYFERKENEYAEKTRERHKSASHSRKKEKMVEDRENKVVWKPGQSIEIAARLVNEKEERERYRRMSSRDSEEEYYGRKQDVDRERDHRRERRRRRAREEQKIPRSRKRSSSEGPNGFDALAKRFRSRFGDEQILTLPSVEKVVVEARVEKSVDVALASADSPKTLQKVDASDIVIDVDAIPLPMEISDDEGLKEISDDVEEEDIRLRLALLRSMADQNDPELTSRFAEIQKLLDEKADLDDGFVSLDEIPLPDIPTKDDLVIVKEESPFDDEKLVRVVVDEKKSDEAAKKIGPGTNAEVAKQRKQKAKLFRAAKDRVDEAYRQGWSEFGSLFQDTLHGLKTKKNQSDDAKVVCRCAASVVDTLLEKKEFVPPWIIKVRENYKTICEGSKPVDEEDDEAALRQAVLKSLAEKKKVEKPPEQPTPSPVEEVPEEDIELMRAMLLVQVSRKARAEADAITNSASLKKSTSTKSLDSMNVRVPKVNPVIIKITAQSDDECEWSGESHAEKLRRSKEARDRSFAEILKSAKKIRKQNTDKILLSEDAIKLLPDQMQREYHSLKQRLNLLDKKKKIASTPPPLKVQNQSAQVIAPNADPADGADLRPVSSSETSKENVPVVEEDVSQLEKRLIAERQVLSVTLDKTIERLKELAAEKEKEQELESKAKAIQEKIEALHKELAAISSGLKNCKAKKTSLADTVKQLREEFATNQKKCAEAEKLCLQIGTKTQGKRFQLQPFDRKAIHDKVAELRGLCANLKTGRNKPGRDVVQDGSNMKKVQNGQKLPTNAQESSSNYAIVTSSSGAAENPSSSCNGYRIDPMKVVCPHDLHGICKDDQCVFQHLPRPS